MKTNILKSILIALLTLACEPNVKNDLNSNKNDNNTITKEGPNYEGGAKPSDRLFPDKLRYLPIAISAAHYPNPTYAEFQDGMYVWKHNTTVVANEDLQLVEYGSFVYTEKGWYLRVTMTPKDFETYYGCKDAILKKGVVYTDGKSWRRSDTLIAGDAMWYYIAKDKDGKLVKGTAPIETEAKLISLDMSKNKIVQSDFTWTGYGEIGDYSLTGKIKLKSADIQFSGDTLKQAALSIDVTSITHDQSSLVDHLKGEDFFDVGKFPNAEFEVITINNNNIKQPIVEGNLKIKGISKLVKVPLMIASNAKGKTIKGKLSIDRTVFGIKYNSKSFFSNLGDQAIKNNFDLVFVVEVM